MEIKWPAQGPPVGSDKVMTTTKDSSFPGRVPSTRQHGFVLSESLLQRAQDTALFFSEGAGATSSSIMM